MPGDAPGRAVALGCNPKLEHLKPLAAPSQLRALALIDPPKVRDLEPLASLRARAVLTYEGGMNRDKKKC